MFFALAYIDYMKKNKAKLLVIILAIALFFITLFIILNSALDFETSHASSGVIVDIIVPDSAKDVLIDYKTPEYYIRKAAHFLEYAVLGCAVVGFAIAFSDYRRSKFNFLGFELFYVLSIAVLDEHIQSLSDRSSLTGDILLDFAGALTGIVLIHFIFYIIKRKKSKNRKNAEE